MWSDDGITWYPALPVSEINANDGTGAKQHYGTVANVPNGTVAAAKEPNGAAAETRQTAAPGRDGTNKQLMLFPAAAARWWACSGQLSRCLLASSLRCAKCAQSCAEGAEKKAVSARQKLANATIDDAAGLPARCPATAP